MRKMADDDYTDSFSDDSEDEGVEQSQGSVELFSGYYGQEGFRAEYIYDAIEAAGCVSWRRHACACWDARPA